MADDSDSDDALVARAGSGDRAAASLLIARHSPTVLAVCGRILLDRASAEDAAQETFLKVWENAPGWKPQGGGFRAWIHRVAANASLDRLRKRRRELPSERAPEQADGSLNALERLAVEDRSRAVERALAALPDRQRIAVTLCHLNELSNVEAAAAMRISVDAVESLLARGRRSLRRSLSGRRDELMEDAR